ncbi:hypothetical protein BC830DRAFT_1085508 [Chytriomyces sp. MP71]|nr:hypothetical protein BC830DRAFT_1085508 [Chytriomyces sp. MP71]
MDEVVEISFPIKEKREKDGPRAKWAHRTSETKVNKYTCPGSHWHGGGRFPHVSVVSGDEESGQLTVTQGRLPLFLKDQQCNPNKDKARKSTMAIPAIRTAPTVFTLATRSSSQSTSRRVMGRSRSPSLVSESDSDDSFHLPDSIALVFNMSADEVTAKLDKKLAAKYKKRL